MTLGTKGSRRIAVDGVSYRWRSRHRPTYCQAMGWSALTFAVGLAEGAGSTLVVTMPFARPDNWMRSPTGSVTPSIVEAGIRRAVKDSHRSGQPRTRRAYNTYWRRACERMRLARQPGKLCRYFLQAGLGVGGSDPDITTAVGVPGVPLGHRRPVGALHPGTRGVPQPMRTDAPGRHPRQMLTQAHPQVCLLCV